jgi:hypothetical protein
MIYASSSGRVGDRAASRTLWISFRTWRTRDGERCNPIQGYGAYRGTRIARMVESCRWLFWRVELATVRTPTRPTIAAIKRLFALSGNRCAFPKCRTLIVQGAVLAGEVCHIKGRKRGAPRYDSKQTPSARHAYGNLLLLCSTHHTIVDADAESYSVEVLRKMKAIHEGRASGVSKELTEHAAKLLRGNSVRSVNQRGGITAGTVNITMQHAPQPDVSAGERFGILKRRVLYVGLQNNLPVELHALRTFLVESDLIQRPDFRNFFERWLTRPPVVVGWSGLNAFTREDIESLGQELISLQV